MSLRDALSTPAAKEPSGKVDAKQFNFTAEYAPHDRNTATITATTDRVLNTEDDMADFVRANGGVVPDGYRVRLVESRHNTAGWTRDDPDQKYATTRPVWYYKFIVEPVSALYRLDEIIASVGRQKPVKRTTVDGDATFQFLVGDLQLGKMDGDGAEGTVRAFEESVERAVAEYRRLRKSRSIGRVHIFFGGDSCEGNVSQNGRNMWRTELTVTEQYRLFRRLMKHAADRFLDAPLIELSVVNGNHDETQRFQATRADDGHATESAIALDDAFRMNPDAYGHISVYVPANDESYMTREVGSSILTLAHGHQWSRGKSMEWWKGQTFNFQSAGVASFLFHGHEHEFSLQTRRGRTVICVPTFESESTWWRHKTGDRSVRGGLSLITDGDSFTDLRVV
jgi:predicted phosphodiesterase